MLMQYVLGLRQADVDWIQAEYRKLLADEPERKITDEQNKTV